MESPANDTNSPGADDGTGVPERSGTLAGDSRRALGMSVLLVGSLALGILAALTPRYETNDDAGMSAIAAGRCLVDRPDEHLLFSNVIVGLGLKSLYEGAPRVPWYGGYLFLTGCLSLLAITFVCLRLDLSEWTLGLTGAFLWVAGIPALTQLQFTRISFLAALAGILLLLGTVRAAGAGALKWLAILYLVAADLIRFESLCLACVVLSPVIAWMLWRARTQKGALAPIFILAACLALGLGADHFNKWYYARDVAWRNYYPLSAERVEFIDYGHVEYNPQTAKAFAKAGWLPVDLLMLRNWAFLDRERYNRQSLHTILEALPASHWKAARPWLALLARFGADGELWGLLACGAASLCILATARTARFVPLSCYAVTAAACALLYRQMHLPPRVYCPAASACALAAIVFSAGPRSFAKGRPWTASRFGRPLALTLVAALVVWRAGAMWRSNANFLSFHKEAVQMMKELSPRPDQLYVVWAGDFPLEYVTLPLESQSLPRDFKALDLNWTYGFSQRRMEQFGVSDLLSIVRRGDGTFFVCQKDQIELCRDYLRAHDGVELTAKVTFAHHALYDAAIYQVASGTAPSRSP